MEKSLRLLINVEGRRVDAAILEDVRWLASESVEGNPVENLAPTLRAALASADAHPAQLHHWIYSGGPGSLLGLRSLAMLLSTWETSNRSTTIKKARFSGMVWAARELQRSTPGQPFLLISPWRTNAWNVLPVGTSPANESDLKVIEGDPSIDQGLPVYVMGERLRSTPPAGSQTVPLPTFNSLKHHLDSPQFLIPTARIEPLQSGTTEYKKWTPSTPGS